MHQNGQNGFRRTHEAGIGGGLASHSVAGFSPGERPERRHTEVLATDAVSTQHRELKRVVERQLELIGEDPGREGLLETPARAARALSWLTRGYAIDVEEVVGDAVFKEDHRGMVVVRDIEMYSLCEHHMLPFFGKVHIGYVPDGKVIGLSKLPRIVEVFARRLQVQERLTEQIVVAVEQVLQPLGVGVMIEAVHLCMMMRGVEKQRSSTITSALRGVVLEDPRTRDEFLRLVQPPSSAW